MKKGVCQPKLALSVGLNMGFRGQFVQAVSGPFSTPTWPRSHSIIERARAALLLLFDTGRSDTFGPQHTRCEAAGESLKWRTAYNHPTNDLFPIFIISYLNVGVCQDTK